jgi:hypothetical protein
VSNSKLQTLKFIPETSPGTVLQTPNPKIHT